MRLLLIVSSVFTFFSAVVVAQTLVSTTDSTVESEAVKIIGSYDPAALKVPTVPGPQIWKDPSEPLESRVHDLVRRMSLAEKLSQLL
ncbi:MAG: hypothetical protein M1378_12815, partial [Bacteroidetes bacterium]|nr:hypothetical protein [Bacteroidota bacterium]